MSMLLGHDVQAAAMLDAARSGRLHHGWILAGPRGIGKASFARAMALRLLAEAAGPPPGGMGLGVPADHPVARLIASGGHPDYAELTCQVRESGDVARNISVDQVRGLHRLIHSAPSLSARRLVVIDSADDLERGAANALLKTLEEPPPGMTFLLVAHAPARLLPTIRSRCHMLRFDRLDDQQMTRILRNAQPELEDVELEALLAVGAGSPGTALGYAGLNIGDMERSLTTIAATGDPDNRERLALARQLGTKAARQRYEAFLERAPAFIALAARGRTGQALGLALDHWEQARQLAAGAIVLALESQSVVFELAGHVAALAPMPVNG
ncbi:DNA polymerase III subunit delta' [Sphingobium sp. AN641]|uniref:DNA polymerase III subunit delta' n=1 Tax=Sphingobium sp. AN641 TaxID=3133443 RepID=UPI0030BB7336